MLATFGAQSLVEHFLVERERAPEAGAAEIAVAAAVAQQRIGLLDGEVQQRLEFVERQQDRVALRPDLALDRRHRRAPFVPVARRLGDAGLAQQVDAVEQQPRVDVPRHAVQPCRR